MKQLVQHVRRMITQHIERANYRSALEQQGQLGVLGPYSMLCSPGASQRH